MGVAMSDDKFVCECKEYCRIACEGLAFYREVEGKKYCVLHCPVQDKVDDFNVVLHRKLSSFEYDFRGVYFPAELSFRGMNFVSDVNFWSATFSADVYFWSATFSAAVDFSLATFSADANFSKATFSANANFSKATFSADADFSEAKFSAVAFFWLATFSADAHFSKATFSAADFSKATFSAEVDFSEVKFSAAVDFSEVKFSAEVNFSAAEFSAAASFWAAKFSAATDFWETKFSGDVSFWAAKLESYLRFTGAEGNLVFGKKASLFLKLAQIAKPEQLIFHTVRLRPHWFVNVDSRKFEFTNVNWVGFDPAKLTWQERATQKLKRALTAWPEYIKHGVGSVALHNELQAMSEEENHYRLLSIACRQLATNAEDNNRYSDAARFRYASMDARRLEKWRGWDIFTLDWWYWLVSGYGERIPRATICLLVLLLSFGYLFTRVGFETKVAPEVAAIVQEITPTLEPLKELPLPSFWDGLNYAMSAALFQRPEPKAHSNWAKTCVSLEMIFVPLQAALLALAIRRRFMR